MRILIHEILIFMRFKAGHVRRSEWVIFSFLVYAAALAMLLPVSTTIRIRVIVLNTSVILSYAFLVLLSRTTHKVALGVTRDWTPLALIILAYREMGWFAQPHLNQNLETSWVIWDRAVLRGGGEAAIEVLGPLLPSILEISYALVYTLAPFAVAMLYVYGHRERVDQFLFIFAIGVLLCYGQFPFWPSDPPRVVFPNEDRPYDIVFRWFNLWMLGNYGIHTSVFPSAHVAGAFVTAMGAWRTLPEHKWVGRLLLVMAILIAIATVYGRYHYLVDAVAGIAMAILAFAITTRKQSVTLAT
jgi:hypothetical protein